MSVLRSALLGVVLSGLAACGSDATEAGEGPPTVDEADRDDDLRDSSRGPSDDDPDRNADPDAPSPKEDSKVFPATQDSIIERFAPHVHLHPDDKNRPANVDWYLSRVSMRFHHSKCPDHEILPKGRVTQAALIAQNHEDNKSFCRHDGNKKVTSATSENFFLEVADDATYAGSPRAEWKTYVVWIPRDDKLVDIQYWFFYPYNDNLAMFNHESDWEHVRVTVDPKGSEGQGSAVEVKMSAHHGGTIMRVPDPRLKMDDETHPVTYSSKGSHANYPQPGTYDIEGTAGIAKDNAKPAARPEDVWKTETSVLQVGTRAAPKNGQLFVKYWGRWGQLGDLPETDGVTRHFP